ncbi:MAG: NAD(P)/FAD-dependent oxidoreductase [Acidimicrobiales bacterium]
MTSTTDETISDAARAGDQIDPGTMAAAIDHAELTPLLCALASSSGDLSLLEGRWRPDQARLLEPDAGLSPDAQQAARRAARRAILERRPTRSGGAEHTATPETLRSILAFAVGDGAVDDCLPLLGQELAVTGTDLRAPTWHKDTVAPDRDFRVAVIGAGMSGIATAHRLAQAGVECVVIEKNGDVGGTWLENTYPGCRVDVPNHLYSYSFAQRHDWPQHFSTQPVLLDYFRDCARRLGVTEAISFGTEVVSADYQAATQTWTLGLRCSDGTTDTLRVHALISAVGQLNRPNVPSITGAERFEGVAFHSARWRHDVDLHAKTVAVIGTGASAAQFIPVIAEQASELRVFQRTPNWLIPTPDYHQDVAPELEWLFAHVPSYAEWYRFWLFWRNTEGMLPAARVDADWASDGRSVGALNDLMREVLTAYLHEQFADTPELLADVVPDYPPAAKRVIRDNGAWATALKRDNVNLITADIERITPGGLITCDGVEHPADVIIYATGFNASDFLSPIRIVGRDGVELHDHWHGDARAYLGMTIPGFPNLFCLYGPNTNIVINGSIIYFSECQIGYILEAIHALLATGHRSLECRPEVHDTYNEGIDAANSQMAWGAAHVNTWYKNSTGRVSQNWPGSLIEYWHKTRGLEPADYQWL